MKPNIFVSYSRREVPFVNILVANLEKDGFEMWLDFRNLVPGSPWDEQIVTAIDNTETVLIVISSSAIDSPYVLGEIERVFELGKRVVLAIFEGVELPDNLKNCEWVDFRGSYSKAYQELKTMLTTPAQKATTVHDKSFKAPAMVWLAFGLSLITALFSLPAIWTIWVTLILLPLPYKIIKRNFNFNQTQAALILLPFALLMTNEIVSDLVWQFTYDTEWYSLPFAVILFFVLRSPTLQRWGKPVATMDTFANPYDPDVPHPTPTRFYIDHAQEDSALAQEITEELVEHGHLQIHQIENAEVVLALISRFKHETSANPERQVVYPIILQTTKEEISESLQRVQWIDYRNGVRHLKELAELLPEPERLLKALALRPMGNQLILPLPITITMYFWGALAMFNAGACIPYIIQFSEELLNGTGSIGTILNIFVYLALFGVVVSFAIRQLIDRKKPVASWWGMILVTAVLGLILYLQNDRVNFFEDMIMLDWINDFRGYSARLAIDLYIYGNLVLGAYLLWVRRDLMRWYPSSRKTEHPTVS